MTRFIVAANPLAGHTLPLLRLAADLSSRGHDVSFLGGSRFADEAAAAGADPHSLSGPADYDDRRFAEAFPGSRDLAPGPERLNFDTEYVFGNAISAQHVGLQKLLESNPDNVLVSDNLFLGGWPSALGVGRAPLRWIAVGIAPVYAASQDTTPMGPAPAGPGQDSHAANRAANAALAASFAPAFGRLVEICADLGARLSAPDYLSAVYGLPDVTAQLTVAEFEFPRSDLPEQIRYVGHLTPNPVSWAPPDWWPELADADPVVLVTQGTLANQDLGELVQPTLEALGDGQGLTVAALGRAPEDLTGAVPANARVEAFIPFDEILDRVAVFVTNGGYAATQNALAHGVPVVVAGTTEDKPAIAARVAYHGLGIDLATSTPTPAQVREAVATILADPGYRVRTGRLAQAYRRHDALAAIAGLGEVNHR